LKQKNKRKGNYEADHYDQESSAVLMGSILLQGISTACCVPWDVSKAKTWAATTQAHLRSGMPHNYLENIMKDRTVFQDFIWMAIGAIVLLVVMLLIRYFHTEQSPIEEFALRAKKINLVTRMRQTLDSASDAEKSAVMAVTDQDSRSFAEQARAATVDVARQCNQLKELLIKSSTQTEKDLLAQFVKVFIDFQRIDNDLLSLAVKNTNIKAYGLAFGPAADALKDMDTALSRLVAKSAGSPEAGNVALLAFGAQTAALRLQVLLAPHIAEESDKKMDELEALMTKEDRQVRDDLDGLASLRLFPNDSDLKKAATAYARFNEVRGRILAFSRENTNVRSLAISLSEKRKVLLICQDALSALQQAILEEPIAGVKESEFNPRRL
jgi:hypothetical protein